MVTITNKQSSVENINNRIEWVPGQIKAELVELGEQVRNNFYVIEGDTVKYDIDLVKMYLNRLIEETNGMDSKEAWKHLRRKGGNSAAWIMAVQIALEVNGFDVGKIDGVLGDETKGAVRKFQEEYNLGIDGLPGKQTIEKLIEVLNSNSSDESDNNGGSGNQGGGSNEGGKPKESDNNGGSGNQGGGSNEGGKPKESDDNGGSGNQGGGSNEGGKPKESDDNGGSDNQGEGDYPMGDFHDKSDK